MASRRTKHVYMNEGLDSHVPSAENDDGVV